jgi:hypothetical protein
MELPMDNWTSGFRIDEVFRPRSVRDAHGSTSIKAAVAALETVPGLQIDRHAGHDA